MMFCDRGHENYFATEGVDSTDYFIGMDAQAGQDVSAEDAEAVVTGGRK